jgi:hypothetical protein
MRSDGAYRNNFLIHSGEYGNILILTRGGNCQGIREQNGVLVIPLAETMPMNGCSRELERKVGEKRWRMKGRMPAVTAQRSAPKTTEFEMR